MANDLQDLQFLEELSFGLFNPDEVVWDKGNNCYLIIGACFYKEAITDLSNLGIETIFICKDCNMDNLILPENFILINGTNKLYKYYESEGLYLLTKDQNKLELVSPNLEQEVII